MTERKRRERVRLTAVVPFPASAQPAPRGPVACRRDIVLELVRAPELPARPAEGSRRADRCDLEHVAVLGDK